ncbi:5-formyltetrahydrofolate cyclo-ligase [Falsirhodobacter sp. alg1]|uniref:5-formyltetrahydrofolate cyclo-ligase n=1 Tax=Falsirhodobacter sp. alg1 TaxID=1472418 RepID=UPI0005F033B8|nr:5-formyltetrahydrofolate cyclo-ligase [Falsirhodobacter sp. alg1]
MKAEVRKAALSVRAAAHATGQGAAADHLAEWLASRSGCILAGYLPIGTEADPRPAMAAHNGPVCVPVIEAPAQPLRFRAWTPGAALQKGAFGVSVPATGEWLVPEVVIVPLVAFDSQGFRLGYGGGFYDRTLQALRANGPVFAMGFAFAAQQHPALPVEATDQPLDAVMTERGIVRF